MATRRRRVPAAVQEQLERKHRQAATLAERQGAALGSEARRQLKPLLQGGKADKRAEALEAFSISFATSTAAANAILAQMAQSISVRWGPRTFGHRTATIPQAPSVDLARLDALQVAEPYKVIRPVETNRTIPDMVACITAWRASGLDFKLAEKWPEDIPG